MLVWKQPLELDSSFSLGTELSFEYREAILELLFSCCCCLDFGIMS